MGQSLSCLQHINGKIHDCINNGKHCIFGDVTLQSPSLEIFLGGGNPVMQSVMPLVALGSIGRGTFGDISSILLIIFKNRTCQPEKGISP